MKRAAEAAPSPQRPDLVEHDAKEQFVDLGDHG
jgi:hypothetical protein